MASSHVRRAIVTLAAVALPLTLAACGGSSPSTTTTSTTTTTPPTTTTTPPPSTHAITPDAATTNSLITAFEQYKIHAGTMLATEKLAVCTSCDVHAVKLAYDAPQNRDYALLYAQFVGTASYNSQVAAQDGGNVGLFWRTPGSAWVVWTHSLPSTCAAEFPTAVSALWGLQQYPDCPATLSIPAH